MRSFQKKRITCGGALVEDISEYSLAHGMIHLMKLADIRDNDLTEGFEARQGNIDDPNPGTFWNWWKQS